jgi:hypothetical protein
VRKFLCPTDRKNNLRMSLVAMAVAVLFLPGNSSEILFRDVSEGNELAVAAIDELNAYYAGSPGFKYAKAIAINTELLEQTSTKVERSDHVLGFGEVKHTMPHAGGRVSEWEGTIPERSGRFELRKSNGKFYGSYHEKDGYHVITPYRIRGVWLTMMLVYDGQFPQCGTSMTANRRDEEVEK